VFVNALRRSQLYVNVWQYSLESVHIMSASRFAQIAVVLMLALSACRPAATQTRNIQVRMTMLPGGKEPVFEIFANKMTDVRFVSVESPGGVVHADFVENGLADATLIQTDVAYFAFTKGTVHQPRPHTKLRAMAMASASAMHLIVRSGVKLDSLKDLRGLRVGVGWPGTSTEPTFRNLLPKLGIALSEVHLEQSTAVEIPKLLEQGSVDAAILVTRYPTAIVHNALAVSGTRVASLPLSEIRQLRDVYPFFRHVTIPAVTYGQRADVSTVGIDTVFVCREDLSEEVVYSMVNALFASLPELAERQPGYREVRMDQAPATPIPLHPGAARFYRERQIFR
jgi:TRAP transporter TAXI family solute receptor